MPSDSINWYLWNSTVREDIPSELAISLAERPSASSWRISRCRGVSNAAGSFADCGPLPDGVQHFACQRRRDENLPRQRGPDRHDQFLRRRVFQHIA